MSILNVDKIQPIGGGSTITVDATDIQASTGTITANSYTGVDNTLKVSIGGTEYVRTHSTGQVSIGSTFMWRTDTVAQVYGKSPDLSLSRFNDQFMIAGNETSGAINTGAGIQFFGHDGVSERGMAYIRGLKENGTSGDRASYLAFATRINGGTLEERLRIQSNGDIVWNGTGTATPGVGNATVGMGFEPRNGTIFLSRGDNATLLSNRNNDGRHIHFAQGGDQKFAIGLQNSGADLTFNSGGGVSPTERLRITSGGTVNIGGDYTNTTGKLKVTGVVTVDGGFNLTAGSLTAPGGFSINSGNVIISGDIAHDADSDTTFGFGAGADTFRVQTNGNERLRIGSNGSVGIGTDYLSGNNSVYHKLMVEGDTTSQIAVAKIVRRNSSASNSTYTLEVDSSSHTSNVANGGAMSVDVNSGRAFTINGFGRVGIGTNNPQAKLEIAGSTTNILGYSDGQVQIVGNNPIAFVSQSNLNPALNRWGFKLASQNDGDFSIYDYRHGSNRLLIASDGHVAIGGYGDPGSILDVREYKNEGETMIRLFNTDNGDTTTQTAAFYMSPDSRGGAKTGLRAIKENASFANNAGRDISLSLNVTQNNSQVEALRIKSRGYREIRNYHYGPYAFTNDTWKSTFTIGDPGDHKFTTVKFILTLIDGNYRQGHWQGEYTIFASNAVGGPGVDYHLHEHWQQVGSANWSGGTVSYQMSGGAFQFKADNGHNDANGNAYIHILEVIGHINGSDVATISA